MTPIRHLPLAFAVLCAPAFAQDGRAPGAPPELRAEVYSRTAAELFWGRAIDPDGFVRAYEIRRDGRVVATGDTLSHFTDALVPGATSEFTVIAIDSDGLRSAPARLAVTTGEGGRPDGAARPLPPANLRAAVYSRTAAELFWDRAPVRGLRYEVRRDGRPARTIDGTSLFVDDLADGVPVTFDVVALDADGRRSGAATVRVDTGARGAATPVAPAPVVPAPVAPAPGGEMSEGPSDARLSVYSDTAAELFWSGYPDASGRIVTLVSRDGTEVGRTDGRSFFDAARTPGARHRYTLVGLLPDGRRSAAVTIGDSATPTPTPTLTPTPNPNPNPNPNPASPAPDLLPAAAFPTTDADGFVVWPFAPVAGGLSFEVSRFAQLPAAQSGRQPRINDMFSGGGRLFVLTEQDGYIYDVTGGQARLWFDVATAIRTSQGRVLDTGNLFHGGLRSAAFHPDFADNGKLYTTVMEQRPADASLHTYLSDSGGTIPADSVLIEWTVDPATMTVDPASYREVFRVGVPEYDHPIKQAEFDPTARPGDADYGLLYIGHGDGSVMSSTARGGQRNDALGKVLRIDPLQDGRSPFRIPADNPFVGDASMLDAVYSIGHRNPHHLAFAADGTLIVANAGRDNVEEIDLVVAGSNHGWSEREGAYVQRASGSIVDGIAPLPANDAVNGFTYPAAQFGHEGRPGQIFVKIAVVGGPVIRPAGVPVYLYNEFVRTGAILYSRVADLQAATTRGAPSELTIARTFLADVAFDHDDDAGTPALARDSLADIIREAPSYDGSGRTDTRLGADAAGDPYVLNKRNGIVYRLRAVGAP